MTTNMSTQLKVPFLVSGMFSRTPQATTSISWLARHLPDPEAQREYARERCVVVATEALGEAMEDAGLSQAMLADRLGKSRGYVSKVLNGAHNMTLHTLGEMLWACNVEVHEMELSPLGVIEVANEDALQWHLFDGLSPPEDAAMQAARVFTFPTIFADSTNCVAK